MMLSSHAVSVTLHMDGRFTIRIEQDKENWCTLNTTIYATSNYLSSAEIQMIIHVPFLDVSSGPTNLERSFAWKRPARPLFQRRLTLHTCSWPCPIRPPFLPQNSIWDYESLSLSLYQRTEWHHRWWCCCIKPLGRPKAHTKPFFPTNLCPPNPPKDGCDAMPSLLKFCVWGHSFVAIGPFFYIIFI